MFKKKELSFDNLNLEDCIFFDIETVTGEPTLEEGTDLYESFKYKVRYDEEVQRKNFNHLYVNTLYQEKGALYPEFNKIVCITVAMVIDGRIVVHSFRGHNEGKILSQFNSFLSRKVKEQPDAVLVGFNNKAFDTPCIFRRSIVHGIEPVKTHINQTGLKPWESQNMDLMEVWKQTSFYNVSLINVAVALGIPSPKDGIDGSQVSSVYYKEGDAGLDRITEYCEKDVITLVHIFNKLKFQPLTPLATEDEVEERAQAKENEAPEELPPLFERLMRVGEMTPEEEEEIIASTRKSSGPEKERVVQLLQASLGPNELDQSVINQILAK